jgi:hypothetical protein
MGFHGAASFIHSTIQIHPLAANLNICLVTAPGPAHCFLYGSRHSAKSTDYRITQRRIVHGATETPSWPIIWGRSL